MNAEITRDPLDRAALQQVAAQLSARTATLEDPIWWRDSSWKTPKCSSQTC